MRFIRTIRQINKGKINMTDKAKLTKLILEYDWNQTPYSAEQLANYLVNHGVCVLEQNYSLNTPPCWYCDHGWGSISKDGVKSCHDTCEELKRYNDNLNNHWE